MRRDPPEFLPPTKLSGAVQQELNAMRIAHVITRMIVGGAQENTLLCCQDLRDQYHDDVLLVTGPALGPEGDLLSYYKAGDLPIEYIDTLRRPISIRNDWLSYRTLLRLLRDFRPDVVHTHSAKGGILGRFAAWKLGVPAIVHTVHGAPFHRFQHPLVRSAYRWCEKRAAGRCHQLVSVADAMTDQLVAAGVAPREKFRTIYSGMNVESFQEADRWREQTREQLSLSPEHVVVGKIARLFELKGHEDVIRAARTVVDQCPHVRFVFVGDGVLKDSLRDLVARYELEPYFRFVGLVPPDRIPAMIGAMDILVHASLREGLARTLPQALIAGKPVVSYDVDGAREVVITGETGFLVEPRNVADLAGSLLQLARDRTLRHGLGTKGKDVCVQRFGHLEMTDRLRELYLEILERPGPTLEG